MTLLFLALLLIGFAGGYTLRDPRFSFVLYHIGGLGSLGLLASGVGFIASKKGYGYWRAFALALSNSILLGVIAAYLVTPTGDEGRPAACGGSISLIVVLIFVVIWTFVKRRDKVTFINQASV
jgi:hypothetical protein